MRDKAINTPGVAQRPNTVAYRLSDNENLMREDVRCIFENIQDDNSISTVTDDQVAKWQGVADKADTAAK